VPLKICQSSAGALLMRVRSSELYGLQCSIVPVPIAAPLAASEFRAAAEAELLNPVVRLLRERECVVEAQRSER
jgi:hypothetical protein